MKPIAVARRTGSARVISQVLNSGSSAVFSLVIVAATTDAELGEIALQLTGLSLMLGLVRTGVSESILFKVPSQERPKAAWIAGAAGLGGGVVAFLVSLLIGTLFGTSINTTVALSCAAFAVVVFDGLRFSAFALGQDPVAARADLVWLLLMGGGVCLLAWRDSLTAAGVSWVYGASASIAALHFLRIARLLGPQRIYAGLLRETRFGVDFVLQVGAGQLALFVGAASAGLEAVGVIRAAVTWFSPLATIVYASRLLIVERASVDQRRRRARSSYSAVSLIYSFVLIGAFWLLPGITESPFGALPYAVLALTGLSEWFRHLTQVDVDEMRMRGNLRPAVGVRSVGAVALVVLSFTLGHAAGDTGLALARTAAFGSAAASAMYFGRHAATRPHPAYTTGQVRPK